MVKIINITKESECIKEKRIPAHHFLDMFGKQTLLSKTKFGDKAKDRFFSELSMLLESGIDIHSAITLICDGAANTKEHLLFGEIKSSLIEGSTFYGILKSSNQFSTYDCATIKIGEQTGQLSSVLSELASYYFKKIEHKKMLIKAVSYPIMVLVTAVMALFFMLSFVVPMFEDIFLRAGDELPSLTRFIITLSVFFREDFVVALGALLFVCLVLFIFKDALKLRVVYSSLVLRIPILGRLIRLYYFEKLFHSLALLCKARVPIHEALWLVNDIVVFDPINKALRQVYADVMNGESLAFSMGKSRIFEERTILLVKIGEAVKRLDDIFEKLYRQHSKELEHRISQFGATLEPVLIILVGLFVGFILVAMYLPIFQLGTSVF